MDELAERIAQSFDHSEAGAPVTPCCKDVEGEWVEYPKVVPDGFPSFEGLDGIEGTQTLGGIPKGVAIMGRFHVRARIQGRLRCRCLDDGRTLSDTAVDVPFEADVVFPVGSVNILKKLVPSWITWLSTLWELAEALKNAYDIYSQNPELAQQLLEQAMEAVQEAVRRVANSAWEICANRHMCAAPLVA